MTAPHMIDPGRLLGQVLSDASPRLHRCPGDGGFATAPDLVRFTQALSDGTLL